MHLRTTSAAWVSEYVGVGGSCLNGLGCFSHLTWYISDAGSSWNLSGECSFDLFTACKQAYLVVLTVNVIVVFLLLWCFDESVLFLFSLAACVLWVKAAQTSGWPSLIQSWCKHLLTVFFFYQMSIVSDECIYFWSCPHFCKEFAQSVRLRWRQDPLFFLFLFLFWGFQAENQKWDTKHSH